MSSPQHTAAHTIHSVAEVTRDLKNLIEKNFKALWLRGEISNCRPNASGHLYFTLKDPEAQIAAVMFKGSNRLLKFHPQDGMGVIVYGHLSVYEPRGQYQIVVTHLEPDGLGALQMAFEQLKEKLKGEGLFAAERKRALPFLPCSIGIVTSAHGAAVHDMVSILRRRHPGVVIRLYGVKVQGAGAAEEIAAALDWFSCQRCVDVVIVGRGGGSIEDLWAFNEEIVARAVVSCQVPVVSGVGHETDFTICDFVADLRAPTPSAAAELCVPVREELLATVVRLRIRLRRALVAHHDDLKRRLLVALRCLPTPQILLDRLRLRVAEATDRLERVLCEGLDERRGVLSDLRTRLGDPRQILGRHRLVVGASRQALVAGMRHFMTAVVHRHGQARVRLRLLSPLGVLERGYVICRDQTGRVIGCKRQTHSSMALSLLFHDGDVRARVEDDR